MPTFSEIDTNHDGVIDQNEWMAAKTLHTEANAVAMVDLVGVTDDGSVVFASNVSNGSDSKSPSSRRAPPAAPAVDEDAPFQPGVADVEQQRPVSHQLSPCRPRR